MADEAAPGNGPRRAHAQHDPELVAALLDRDLGERDRTAGAALIESCAACRTLLEDLRALAVATADLPAIGRGRDFKLTPETAARIRAVPAGEPLAVGARLTGEMIHSTPKHEAHDRLLVASLVDRSISDAERARAEAQLATCAACARLHEDLVALAAATRALPVPARTRDFTISPADAARLRGSRWRRLIAAIGSTRDVFSRPLAIGLTTLGVAGLLVATVPMPFGAGGATAERAQAPVDTLSEDAAGSARGQDFVDPSAPPAVPGESAPAIAAAGPSAEPSAAAEAAPEDAEPDVLFQGGEVSPMPGEPDPQGNLYQTGFDASGSGPSPMFIVAGALLLMGLGLFGLRWTARRLGDG